MKPTYEIRDVEQLRAVADPLRQRILGAFLHEPRTTKQVAGLLGQPPTRLYHHVDILERAGLIELVETRQKRGTTEKYYRAIANRFSLSGLEGAAEVDDTIATAFRTAEQAIRRESAAADGQGRAFMALGTLRLTKSQLIGLQERLGSIAEELRGEKSDEPRESYGFLAAVYPTANDGSR